MSRTKNALTKYEVSSTGEPEAWMQLGKWITNITDDSEDTSEDFSDYAGDGTVTVDITGVAEKYTFEGTYDPTNEAMKFIADLRPKLGEERKIKFRITDPDKTTHTGPATVSDIKYRGGEASDFPLFGCAIRYDEIPVSAPVPGV